MANKLARIRAAVKKYGPWAILGYAVLSVGMYIPIFLGLQLILKQRPELLDGTGLRTLGVGAAALLINRMLRSVRIAILAVVLPRLPRFRKPTGE